MELIIVIAILGILSSLIGIGIPAYQRFADKRLLELETRTILQVILKARSDAIMDGYTRRIYIYPDQNRFNIRKHRYPGNPPGDNYYLADRVTIDENTYTMSSLLDLKPIGTVSMGGHITLKSPKGKYMTLVVQVGSGRIYMKEGKM